MPIHNKERLIEGWESEHTEVGCPYYVNHEKQKTQWDHPFFCKTLEELEEFDKVKYAAYRTAMKVRFLQKRFSMDLVDMRLLTSTLTRHGLDGPSTDPVDCVTVESIVRDLMESCQKPSTLTTDPAVKAELLLNLILNMYDRNRKGKVKALSMKVILGTLSSARLAEKYKFFFKQMENKNKRIAGKTMEQFLCDLLQLVDLLEESSSFGGMNTKAAVDSCFSQAWNGSIGVSEDEFVSWLLKEPQTVVWLPTMHRLSAAESVSHDCKCSVCKAQPIHGFRYKCLKCFNYDMCQLCFFTGRVSKSHKVKHPTQEYCLSTNKKENTKAFMRTIRNNLSKKHRNKQKPRYLPIYSTGQEQQNPQSDGEEEEQFDAELEGPVIAERVEQTHKSNVPPVDRNTTSAAGQPVGRGLDVDERRELANIIQHLEDENRELMHELEYLHSRPPSLQAVAVTSQCEDSGSDLSDWIERDKLDAKQEIIDAHNRQLQKQLHRLRALINQQENDSIEQQHRVPFAPLSANTLQHSPYMTNTPSPVMHDHQIQRSQANSGSVTPVNLQHLIVKNRSLTPLTNPSPILNQSATDTSKKSYPVDSFNPTPSDNNRHQFMNQTDSFSHTPHGGRLPLRVYSTPESLAGLAIDTTVGSGGDMTLGRTHYSLPSPTHSRHYPEEEAQLAELVARMERGMPLDVSRDEMLQHEGVMGEMLHAAGQIGDAFSGMVTNARHAEIAALEKKYESSA